MTSPETPTELEGEVKFYEGKLVCCTVTSNMDWTNGAVSARETDRVEVTDYGTTVAPNAS